MEAILPGLVNVAVGAAVSTAVGYIFGGPDIEGPRLNDLGVQNNAYGSPVSIIYGRMITTGTIVWLENNQLKETKHKESSGKGGGGDYTTYTYSVTFAIAVCEGPIEGIGRIWADNVLVYSPVTEDTITAINSGDFSGLIVNNDSRGLSAQVAT